MTDIAANRTSLKARAGIDTNEPFHDAIGNYCQVHASRRSNAEWKSTSTYHFCRTNEDATNKRMAENVDDAEITGPLNSTGENRVEIYSDY